jgi:hypothetical protein
MFSTTAALAFDIETNRSPVRIMFQTRLALLFLTSCCLVVFGGRAATTLSSEASDSALSKSFSLYANWFDPFIGLRGRYNLTKALYLTGEAVIGGFGVGSEISWQMYAALGLSDHP